MSMPVKQYNIFISYSHKDKDFAKDLINRIKNDPKGAGISYWKDSEEIRYGRWNKQIEDAIDSVEYLILILTKDALASQGCKDEWMYARKNGIAILPVNGFRDGSNFYEQLPKWLQRQHIYDLDEQWNRFMNDINTRVQIAPVPFMAPRLSSIPEYVTRKREIDLLKNLILKNDNTNTISITTTLEGSGGFGKTTLAIALCNDDEIINHFDDGILWVTLGQQEGTERDALHKLYRGLSRDETSFIDIEEAQQKLAEKMEKRNCLVVIDDVWKGHELRKISGSLGNSTVLITTRFSNILPQHLVRSVKVDKMRRSESIALLTRKFVDKVQNQKIFEKLAYQLGHWPLLLKLVSAQIAKRVLEGESPEQALIFVEKKYQRKGITGFDIEDALQRDDSVKKSMEASIELLKTHEKEKLLQLGIFPGDESIPFDTIGLLWEMDDFDTEELLVKLHEFALLDLDFINRSCNIHDVLLHYYKELSGELMICHYHQKITRYLQDFRNFKNKYSWKWYVWHLIQAKKMPVAISLLHDFSWVEGKLFATDISELLKDYEYVSLEGDTKLIYRALKLSAAILVNEKNQLPAQLIGRLGYFENEVIRQLLQNAEKWKRLPWLKPVKPSLIPPGNLSRILKGHSGKICSLLIHKNKIVSGSSDCTIRIWETESGQCLQTLCGHTASISSISTYKDKIISGSNDNSIRMWDLLSGKCKSIFKGHTSPITSVIVYEDKIISTSNDKTIRIWEIKTGRCVQILHRGISWNGSVIVFEGKIISESDEYTVRIWDIESGQCLKVLQGHTGSISSLLIHEQRVITGSYDKTICIWGIDSGQCLQTLHGHKGGISTLLGYGNKIVSGSDDKTICIWEMESGRCLKILEGHNRWIKHLLIHDTKIISASSDSTIRIWEIESGQCLAILNGHEGGISSLSLHGSKLVSGSYDNTISIWNIDSGKCLQKIQEYKGWTSSFWLYKNKIITGSDYNIINIWEMESEGMHHRLQEYTERIGTIKVHKNTIVCTSEDGKMLIWNSQSGKCVKILEQRKESIRSFLIYEKGIITTSATGTISVWDLETGECIRTFFKQSYLNRPILVYKNKFISIAQVYWSSTMHKSGGTRLQENINIWDIETGHCLQTLRGHTGEISSFLLSDGKFISGSDDCTINIWQIETGQRIQILEGHRGSIRILLTQKQKIFSGSADKTIRIWDMDSGKCLKILAGHSESINSLLFYQDKIISGSSDKTIRIWNTDSGHCVHSLEGHTGWITSLLIYDNKIISGSDDKTVRIWEIESGRCLHILHGHLGGIRSLSVQNKKIISTDSSGLLIVHDLENFTLVSKFYSDSGYASHIEFLNNKIISNDKSGQLHILELIK